ncbi:MAG TPA: SET domain-containing protein-lysine N-methyltransferase [Fibrobacteria bacterium]|nr:SET domain-containing protein-lysine N-methyltransferase [Fibrobacteria bacterium]
MESVRALPLAGSIAGARGVFAVRAFAPGDFIARFEGIDTAERTRMSLQFGHERHVEPAEENPLRFLNHACEPNAAFGNGDPARDRDLFAVRAIAPGTEITFDYNAHEDELSHPFECRCGSARCVGLVRGRNFRGAVS